MILYYEPEYVGQIVEKVIRIISDKQVSVVKEINSITDADYYVFIPNNPDWCLRISWVIHTKHEDDWGDIEFNYECPDMAPLPNMPEMCLGRYLTNTRPAIYIKQGYPHVKDLILNLDKNASAHNIKKTILSFLLGDSKKR